MEKLSNFGFRHLRPVYDCHFVSDSTYSTLVGTNIVLRRILNLHSSRSLYSHLNSLHVYYGLTHLFFLPPHLNFPQVRLRIRSLPFSHPDILFTITYGFVRSPFRISTLSSHTLTDSFALLTAFQHSLHAHFRIRIFSSLRIATFFSHLQRLTPFLSIRVITLSLRLLGD